MERVKAFSRHDILSRCLVSTFWKDFQQAMEIQWFQRKDFSGCLFDLDHTTYSELKPLPTNTDSNPSKTFIINRRARRHAANPKHACPMPWMGSIGSACGFYKYISTNVPKSLEVGCENATGSKAHPRRSTAVTAYNLSLFDHRKHRVQ